jgi:Zn ribbon nucleic-acid-binding protein
MRVYKGDAMPKCPKCGRPTKMNWNWAQSDGLWYHECLECGNVLVTKEKVIEVKVSGGPPESVMRYGRDSPSAGVNWLSDLLEGGEPQ